MVDSGRREQACRIVPVICCEASSPFGVKHTNVGKLREVGTRERWNDLLIQWEVF
jgi:hypothetical protein